MIDKKELISWLEEAGIVQQLASFRCEVVKGQGYFLGVMIIDDHQVILGGRVNTLFPHQKPAYYVLPADRLGFIPHVNKQGNICYVEDESLFLNADNPVGILQYTFERAIQVLEKGVTNQTQADFKDEFENYWTFHDKGKIASLVTLDDTVKRVKLLDIIAGNTEDEINFFLTKNPDLKPPNKHRFRDMLYVPLVPEAEIIPPSYTRFWSLQELATSAKSNLTKKNFDKLLKILKSDKTIPLLLSIPRPQGGYSLVSVFFDTGKEHRHPLLNPSSKASIDPVVVNRWDKTYLMQRGGANISLANKKVMIVGCGAIGGQVALEMAKAGILNLTLVDHDYFSTDNLHRHVLGWINGIKRPKVDALADELILKLHHIKVETYSQKIEELVQQAEIDFSQYDLIIFTTGNLTINRFMNQFIKEKYPDLPIIFTWLEPYGIGGHSLLANNQRKTGCFECLLNTTTLRDRSSFAQAGQTFSKSMAGCGTFFTPFSSLDAIQSAIQCVRLSIRVLQGKELDNPFLSWKGDSTVFLENDFVLSTRYNQTSEQLYQSRYSYKQINCKVCQAIKS